MLKGKRGEVTIAAIMITFLVILVGTIIFQATADQLARSTSTVSLNNVSFTSAAINQRYYFTDYRALSSVTIVNGTTLVSSGNYTVSNNIVYNGVVASAINFTSVPYDSESLNISAVAQPTTYMDDGGSRGLASMILIFFGLAIAVTALYPVWKDYI